MPSIAEKRKVLDGRCEVVSYTRDPEAFILRVWRKESRTYWTCRIDGACDIETASLKALDVFLSYSSGTASLPKRKEDGVQEVKPKRPKQGNILEWVNKYLAEDEERVDAGLLDIESLKNKRGTFNNHLIPYLTSRKIDNTRQIKIGVFDRYPIYRAGVSRHTLKRELGAIKQLMGYFHRHRMLDPYEFTADLIPTVKLKDEDLDSNPPIRDAQEWTTILKHLHRFVKNGQNDKRPRVLVSRTRFWTLLLLLKNSGLRPDEALALRWSDIEVQNIHRDTSSGGEVDRFVVHLRVLKSKTRALREVTANVAQPLARWKLTLREWLRDYQPNFKYNGDVLKVDEKGLPIIPNNCLVFAIPEKNEWKKAVYSTIWDQWSSLMELAKDDIRGPLLSPHPYTLYSLRASRAQEMFELGVDPFLAAKQMGHKVDVMSQIYARMPSRKRAINEAAQLPFGEVRKNEEIVNLEDVY